MKCARCKRPLKNPVHVADMTFGQKCAALLYGSKPRIGGQRKQSADERQAELFQEPRQ